MSTPLSALLASAVVDGPMLRVSVPADWSQGRSVFGGLQAAFAAQAMRALVPSSVPLRTLQATFIAPIAGELEISAQVLRTGKSATHVEARIFERGTLCASLIGVFGEARSSVVRVTPEQPPVSTERALPLPFLPGVVPNFLQHFEARLLRGSVPFAGIETREAVYELAFKDSGPASEAMVIAAADFPAPIGLTYLKTPSPGSTLTWMLEFLADGFHQLPITGFRLDVSLLAARDGYTSQSVMVWGPGGIPLALGSQSMLIFG
ncbi:MAG: thioesterase family protein [Myxococcales bacterium]